MLRRRETPFFVALRESGPEGPATVRIDPAAFPSPAAAGMMLADFARHIARAIAETGGAESERAALTGLLDAFEKELRNPTDAIVGGMRQ